MSARGSGLDKFWKLLRIRSRFALFVREFHFEQHVHRSVTPTFCDRCL